MPVVAPLVEAARLGRTADVMALLADGADVNVTTKFDTGPPVTALRMACGFGHTEVVTMLLAANAEVDQRAATRALAPRSAAPRST
jgi:hypothetical protein